MASMGYRPSLVDALLVGAMLLSLPDVVRAQSDIEKFYTGRSVRLIIGYSVGGGYDGYARLLAHHLPKHLPGHPTIVPENMPGAGSLKAANYLYTVAPKDGSVIGIFSQRAALGPLFGQGNFDATKFFWIGSSFRDVVTCVFSTSSPIASWKDMLEKDHILGGMAAGTEYDSVSRVIRGLFHTRSRLVTGYNSATEIVLAMLRGEVDGYCGQGYGTFMAFRSDLLRDKKARFVLSMSPHKIAELQNLPNAFELAENDDKRRIMAFVLGIEIAGRPFLAPPGIPEAKGAALRKAFDQTMTDPDLHAEARKLKLTIEPSTGAAVQEAFRAIYDTPKALIDEAARISGMK
jgi:tripartite-type tricarboxylate transporter receptor subunit TctC